MKRAAIVSAILLAVTQAASAACNSATTPEWLTLENWDLSKTDTELYYGVRINLSIRNNREKAFRMVDGYVVFEDVLGARIFGVGLPPDIKADAGQNFNTSVTARHEVDRLFGMKREDVRAYVCTNAVVDDDGTVARFLQP